MSRIPESVRLLVAHRAAFRCEYCRIPDLGFAIPFQIDHIKPQKHGGEDLISNYAYCCPECNRYKGSDVGSYGDDGISLIPFFHPRSDYWGEHFDFVHGRIEGISPEGKVTQFIFQFNREERIMYRQALFDAGLY